MSKLSEIGKLEEQARDRNEDRALETIKREIERRKKEASVKPIDANSKP